LQKYFFLDNSNELQKPNDFKINYSIGKYWDLYNDTTDKPTSIYLDGMVKEWFDHTFSNFGDPCTNCGKYYNTMDLKYGSIVGGYDGMPRADGGYGCDHRQILVDMWINNENTKK
jgi:hypothetical protein